MAKNLLQVKNRPTSPQVIERKCVSESMEQTFRRLGPNPYQKLFHIAQDIPVLNLPAISR
jgi:hypothetical protein